MNDVISGLQENLITSEMVHVRKKVTIEHWKETIIAILNSVVIFGSQENLIIGLSEFIIRKCIQRPLADIALWRHFRFARNPIISEMVYL